MNRDRSGRSRSPRRGSRSPPQVSKPSKKAGGFKWKDEKKPKQENASEDNRSRRPAPREYRERNYDDDDSSMTERPDRSSQPTQPANADGDLSLDDIIVQKFGRVAAVKHARQEKAKVKAENVPEESTFQPSKTRAKNEERPVSNEKYITVWVNDRLGTKVAVPSLPSDKIGHFKIIAAHSIGRPTEQFIVKRQGERPFKDHLTLADYEISDGVQLDLEIAS